MMRQTHIEKIAMVVALVFSSGARAEERPDSEHLLYLELLQTGGGPADDALRSAHNLLASSWYWYRAPHLRQGEAPALGLDSLTGFIVAGWGRGLQRYSEPYTAGTGGTAQFVELSGAIQALSGAAGATLTGTDKWSLGLELAPTLERTPLSEELTEWAVTVPALVPVRLETPIPLIVAPTLQTRLVARAPTTSFLLEPGLAIGAMWYSPLGLAGLTARLGISALEAVTVDGEAQGSSSLFGREALEGRANLEAFWLWMMPDHRFRLRAGISAGIQQAVVDEWGGEASNLLEDVQGGSVLRDAQAELRLAGLGMLEHSITLGADVMASLGQSRSLETGAGPVFAGYGLMAFVGVVGPRVEVMTTIDLSRSISRELEDETRSYLLDVLWQVHGGVRF